MVTADGFLYRVRRLEIHVSATVGNNVGYSGEPIRNCCLMTTLRGQHRLEFINDDVIVHHDVSHRLPPVRQTPPVPSCVLLVPSCLVDWLHVHFTHTFCLHNVSKETFLCKRRHFDMYPQYETEVLLCEGKTSKEQQRLQLNVLVKQLSGLIYLLICIKLGLLKYDAVPNRSVALTAHSAFIPFQLDKNT